MTTTRSRCKRPRPRASMPLWLAADSLLGFLLGLALAFMAIDHGRQQAGPSPYVNPSTRSLTTGP